MEGQLTLRNKNLDKLANARIGDVVIIVPCFNEEKRFDKKYFENLVVAKGTEWLFVDDGSFDNTFNILSDLCSGQNVKALRLPKNVGKSEAVRSGMSYAKDIYPSINWFGFLDSDGAFSYDEVSEILVAVGDKNFESYDAVFSSRVKLSGRRIERKTYRHLIGRIVTTIFGAIWKEIPYDTQSGFKLFRNTEFFLDAISKPLNNRWFFDIGIVVRMANSQGRLPSIWEIPVRSWVDVSESKISIRESFRLAFEIPRIASLIFVNRKHLNTYQGSQKVD